MHFWGIFTLSVSHYYYNNICAEGQKQEKKYCEMSFSLLAVIFFFD